MSEKFHVSLLEPMNQWRVVGAKGNAPVKHQIAQRRCDGEGYNQRSQQGIDIGQCHWLKHAPSDAGQEQHRHEDQHHNEGGKNDGASDFQRGAEYHPPIGARIAAFAVFTQASENIFHVNDGVVHHFT